MNLYKFFFKSYIFFRRIISFLVIFSITVSYLGPKSYKFREDVGNWLTDEEYLLFKDVPQHTFKNPESNIDLETTLSQKESNKKDFKFNNRRKKKKYLFVVHKTQIFSNNFHTSFFMDSFKIHSIFNIL